MKRRWLAMSMLLGAAASASAQRAARPGRADRQLERGETAAQQPNPRRQALQKQVRQAFANAVRKQLDLNDDQMRSLQRADANFERQRRGLLREERQARVDLAAAMADSTSPDQSRIARQLDVLLQSQRKRADLLESEQKELSGFLTPLQRAKYFAMKERLNRRLQQLAQGDSTGRRGGPPPAP